MTECVRYEMRDGIARIAMDDGKLNVMSPAMLQDIAAAFDRAATDGVPALLASGRPGIFSAGFDLKVLAANEPEASLGMVRAGAELALQILSHPLPVVTAIAGHAYPMGAFLTLASDIRIGGAGPYRIGLNEVAIGIPAPGFALELARQRLTPAALNRTAVTGSMFGFDEAVAAGFLDELVPESELPARADAVARALAGIHLPSHAVVKRRLRQGAVDAIRAAIDTELTLDAYRRRSAEGPSAVRLPNASAA